jgi:hypothetical protein
VTISATGLCGAMLSVRCDLGSKNKIYYMSLTSSTDFFFNRHGKEMILETEGEGLCAKVVYNLMNQMHAAIGHPV